MDTVSVKTILIWALAFAIGGIIARVLVVEYYTMTTINQINNFAASMQQESSRSMKAARQHQLALEQERTRQKELEITSTREHEREHEDALKLAAAKEAAWEQFYKKPKKCEDLSTNALMIECGNHHIQELRKFQAQWDKEHSVP